MSKLVAEIDVVGESAKSQLLKKNQVGVRYDMRSFNTPRRAHSLRSSNELQMRWSIIAVAIVAIIIFVFVKTSPFATAYAYVDDMSTSDHVSDIKEVIKDVGPSE